MQPLSAEASGSRGLHTRWVRPLGPPLFFLGMAVAFTWPLASELASHLPARQNLPDALLHVHRLWWAPWMLGQGRNPYEWTNLLHYPTGSAQYFETLIPIVGVLVWPFQVAGGPLLAYNAAVLLLLGLNGWCAYLLVRDRSGSTLAGLAGGVVYAFSPYLLGHLQAGHLNLVAAWWPALFLLCLLRALERNTTGARWAVAAGICLAASFYTDLQWTLGLGIATLLLVGVRAARAGRGERLRPLWRGALSALVALALAAPLLLGMWGQLRAQGVAFPSSRQARQNSAAVVAFFQPQPAHPLWRNPSGPDEDSGDEQVVALGYVALALTVAGLAKPATRRPFWAACLLLFALLALGPGLHLTDRDRITPLPLDLPMPYQLLQRVPLMGLGRAPARFAAPATLCLAVLAGQGIVALTGRFNRRGGTIGFVCASLIAAELLVVPLPLVQPRSADVYTHLATSGCGGPVFEVPVEPSSEWEKERLAFQVSHRCQISGGYVSRTLPDRPIQAEWEAYAKSVTPDSGARMRATLLAAGFRTIVFWNQPYEDSSGTASDERALAALEPLTLEFESPSGAVYRLH